MKQVLLFSFLCLAIVSRAQVSSTSNAEAQRIVSEQRVVEIQKETAKLEKQVERNSKTIQSKLAVVEKSTFDLEMNAVNRATNREEVGAIKTDIHGLELDVLEKEIKTLEKESKKNATSIKRNTASIEKKKAAIEKMLSQIDEMEQEIVNSETTIVVNANDANALNDTISTNGLVQKQARIDALEKEFKHLNAERDKLQNRINKSEAAVSAAQTNNANAQQRKEKLAEEKTKQLSNSRELETGIDM